jgi:hypothetical protein
VNNRRDSPTASPRIRQGGSERNRKPQEIEDRQAGNHRSDQDPRAIVVVERDECVGRSANLRLMAVDDVCDDEEDNEVDTAHTPQALPERGGGIHAGE